MRESAPFFSVVMAVRNGERWLGESLDSAFLQDIADLEVVVVDDGSNDTTPDILKSYYSRARVIRQERAGVAAARNRAIRESSGRWLAFLDADDRWRPGYLARAREELEKDPAIGLLYADAMEIDESGHDIKPKLARSVGPDPASCLLMKNTITTSAAVANRECALKTGLFREGLRCGEDWDLWLRLALECKLSHLPEILVDYRRHRQGAASAAIFSHRDDNLAVIEHIAGLLPRLDPAILKKARANAYRESAVRFLAAGRAVRARAELVNALRENPLSLTAYKYFSFALLGDGLWGMVLAARKRGES